MNAGTPLPPIDPCLQCGACCATYRVSFYWAEADARGIDPRRIEQLTPWFACMVGTNQPRPRCWALDGVVGREVACTVYVQRPGPCRELQIGDDKCRAARLGHGLVALSTVSAPGEAGLFEVADAGGATEQAEFAELIEHGGGRRGDPV